MRRISITGPESTGKSELALKLAQHFNTLWVPEVSRDYLNDLGRNYSFEDIVAIARMQLEIEGKLAEKAPGLLFCDTDMIVTKIWSEFKYGKCDPWIAEQAMKHRYDLYLLCDTDLPWQEDPLRENPGQREELFSLYFEELSKLNVNFKVISGFGKARLKRAILAVEEAFF